MSSSTRALILLAIVVLSTATTNINNERNVLVRIYSNFAQVYRAAIMQEPASMHDGTQIYRLRFTAKEYSQIVEGSLTMLNVDVIERSITHHPTPNFELTGTKYLYRRDSTRNTVTEVELINAQDFLFREVHKPHGYFYLSPFDDLSPKREPVMPYYEIKFVCNASTVPNEDEHLPAIVYNDRSIQWSPRYLLDLAAFGTDEKLAMSAYADIRNTGDFRMIVKGLELSTSDVQATERSMSTQRSSSSLLTTFAGITSCMKSNSMLDQARAERVFKLDLKSDLHLNGKSVRSVKFLEPHLAVESFVTYAADFVTTNTSGALMRNYNITSQNLFVPQGRLLLREEGRYLGEFDLPDMHTDKGHTLSIGYDTDLSYRRQIEIVRETNSSAAVYDVTYVFENRKTSTDIRLDFVESFGTHRHFEVTNITQLATDSIRSFGIDRFGAELRGRMNIPKGHSQQRFNYRVVIYDK